MTKDTVLLQFLFGGIDSPNYNLTKSKFNIFDYIHIHTYIYIYIYICIFSKRPNYIVKLI